MGNQNQTNDKTTPEMLYENIYCLVSLEIVQVDQIAVDSESLYPKTKPLTPKSQFSSGKIGESAAYKEKNPSRLVKVLSDSRSSQLQNRQTPIAGQSPMLLPLPPSQFPYTRK